MKDVRKVPASAGAEWLLGGFRLLRQSPVGFGTLGLVYGLIALVVGLSAEKSAPLFALLELVLVVIAPVLVGGMVYAARAIDAGGHAAPEHLLQGVRDGKVARLLATLLPQVVALLLCVLLLVLLVGGGDQLQQMARTITELQAQARPDPALAETLPIGRLMLWLLLVFVVGIVAGFFTFVAAPEIMFTDSPAFDAMRRSFRACVRNLPALIVFFVLTAIAALAVYLAVMLVALVARLIAGPMAMQLVAQLLSTAVLMPVITGAMYVGWKQMLADGAAPSTSAATIAL
ncbi:MAG: hypothetical protein HOQ02_13005 [Lysobacter sp.]|nr:hypothetical protein [Lysobacter sp.]